MEHSGKQKVFKSEYTVTQTYEVYVGADSASEARAILKKQISDREVDARTLEVVGSCAMFNEHEIFTVGDEVVHHLFGKGVVTDQDGITDDSRLEVKFDGCTKPRWLIRSESFLKRAN